MMKVFARRAITVAVGGVAAVALAAGPASAHFCYKTWDTAQAAAGKAGSSGWMSFEALATMALTEDFGVVPCKDGLEYLASAAGVELTTPINVRGTMAGGTLKKDEPGTPATSYLNFEALFAAIPHAYEMCGITLPE